MFDTESADRPPLFQDAAAVKDGDLNPEARTWLLNYALDVAASPLDLAWITAQFHVLTCL